VTGSRTAFGLAAIISGFAAIAFWVARDRWLTRITEPVTTHVFLPPDERWVLIETQVDRTLKPRDLGVTDNRELGLLTTWRFIDHEPGHPRPIS
jgi:hypothetical protein